MSPPLSSARQTNPCKQRGVTCQLGIVKRMNSFVCGPSLIGSEPPRSGTSHHSGYLLISQNPLFSCHYLASKIGVSSTSYALWLSLASSKERLSQLNLLTDEANILSLPYIKHIALPNAEFVPSQLNPWGRLKKEKDVA